MTSTTYSDIRKKRNLEIPLIQYEHLKLNALHDELMQEVIVVALQRIGKPPCPFTFFTMGSGGRFEQVIWSDQDHGIIFREHNDRNKAYFLLLGKEISKGLFKAGYPYCDGGVMADNPLWCKSFMDWEKQLSHWVMDSSWENIRHLLIFMDARSLYGEHHFVTLLKERAIDDIHKEHLLSRILENTLHLKKGIGILGQFLTETHGTHTGTLNMKEKVLFPYVNAVRLLSIKDRIYVSPTLSRLKEIPEQTLPIGERKLYEENFAKILGFRLLYGNHDNYDTGHFLAIDKLSTFQKKELKEIMKNGIHLYETVRRLVLKDGHHGAK
ncbi:MULTISPECIES: DUF294 nucleotidyltransferase-like domain-containing protein [unclassified Bacillus (in: firmicutes)]|uniref:DUF294 nucleotidyltransferase-like domain-containing protein n=1 Tax=unclassified Bacillus (in: firmicutes) TaxID=185979 RepID=UPI0008F2D1ED|nr:MULTISPECIES: DUF294 nucleotidyltransferase-like domain-containing protein [unclassified Bacillus (in: firmicutes)]SFB06884.1 CBS domain-containing protein [Bacillus sp. UNCCL13]